MPEVTYYARIDDTHPPERPAGIVRRTHTEPMPIDEAFGRDMQWHPTEYLQRYSHGHNDDDHVEIGKEQAEAVIARWREEYGSIGQR